jgi:hypothetical protein
MTVCLGTLGAVHSHLAGKVRAISSGEAGDIDIAGAFEATPTVRARREAGAA